MDLNFRTVFILSVNGDKLWHFLSTLAINIHADCLLFILRSGNEVKIKRFSCLRVEFMNILTKVA